MQKAQWRAQVLAAFTCAGTDGSPVAVAPGDYLLTEIDDVIYELADATGVRARFRFTEVLQLKRSGVLRVTGTFPLCELACMLETIRAFGDRVPG